MSEEEFVKSILAGLLGGILGAPIGLAVWAKWHEPLTAFFDATLGRLLDRFGL